MSMPALISGLDYAVRAGDAKALTELYAPDAEVTALDSRHRPGNPLILHGRQEIFQYFEDFFGRDMTFQVARSVSSEQTAAWEFACQYRTGERVLSLQLATLRDGLIARQTMITEWDEPPESMGQ